MLCPCVNATNDSTDVSEGNHNIKTVLRNVSLFNAWRSVRMRLCSLVLVKRNRIPILNTDNGSNDLPCEFVLNTFATNGANIEFDSTANDTPIEYLAMPTRKTRLIWCFDWCLLRIIIASRITIDSIQIESIVLCAKILSRENIKIDKEHGKCEAWVGVAHGMRRRFSAEFSRRCLLHRGAIATVCGIFRNEATHLRWERRLKLDEFCGWHLCSYVRS